MWTSLNIIMLGICFYLSMSGFDAPHIYAVKNMKLSKRIFLICFVINLVVAFLVAWISQSYFSHVEGESKVVGSILVETVKVFGKIVFFTILLCALSILALKICSPYFTAISTIIV